MDMNRKRVTHTYKHWSKQKPELYLLAGLWVSFMAVVMAATTLLPATKDIVNTSPALLYKVAMNEEMHRPTVSVTEVGKLISVNLNTMELALYEDGVREKTFTILSRGRVGTAWETPTGKYTIQSKEPKHLSSIGGTWMPYSMQFYGNFFIHGWPTYNNGANVPAGYSGGCIRLSTADAGEVYAFATLGTRVIVSGGVSKDAYATTSRYYLHMPERAVSGVTEKILPSVTAEAFVVSDAMTGDVLWSRGATQPLSPGALVSLATALTAIETVDQYKIVRMGELLLGKSVLRKKTLGSADELPVGTLIYPLLYDTSDTAAKVFAREHGEKKFSAYMNEKAVAIGMTATHFGGGTSLDVSTTTARDLDTLLRYTLVHKHFLVAASLSSRRSIVDSDGNHRFEWENKNPWIQNGDPAYRGGIAKEEDDGSGSAMTLFSIPVTEFGERTIAIVVLGSHDLEGDVSVLKQFVSDYYVFGVEREEEFTREGDEPTPSLFQKASTLLDLEKLLKEDIVYDREI